MRSVHVYWHIYPQDQIKPDLRGNLLCIIEVPWVPGSPVVRGILDSGRRELPGEAGARFPINLRPDHHGILYVGVSQRAVNRLGLTDPQMQPQDSTYASYNRQIVTNARNFFLLDPNRGFQAMPQHMVQLL